MRKLKLFSLALMALFTTNLWADPTYKSDYSDFTSIEDSPDKYMWIPKSVVDDAAWIVSNSTTSTSKKYSIFIDPSTGVASTDNTQVAFYRPKDYTTSKHLTFYLTNITSVSFYAYNSNTGKTLQAKVNGGDAITLATTSSDAYSIVGTISDLSATTNYTIEVFNQVSSSGASEVFVGAIKVTPVNNGPYKVLYKANGGTGTMEDAKSPYTKNTEVTVLANTFTGPTGATFDSWNTKADGSGDSYAPGDKFSATADVTLYAQWAYPATGTGTITYTLTKDANKVSPAVTGVSTLSSSSSAFTLSGLTVGGGDVMEGYSIRINGHSATDDSKYVAVGFTVADGYTFTPSAISVTVYANQTSAMKAKVVLTDGTTSVESNELACASSADSDISFADGAFTGKNFEGNVDVKVYQWGVASKRTYIKSPITITGIVAAIPYAITKDPGITHGSVTVKVGEEEVTTATIGQIVTLTATPEEGYVVDAYDVYKTGEPATKVTVTDGKFTMPAYAVTVSATFKEDPSTALDNTEAGVKAVKRLENGMLVIEKNGVRYNAMGQIIH